MRYVEVVEEGLDGVVNLYMLMMVFVFENVLGYCGDNVIVMLFDFVKSLCEFFVVEM